MIITLNKKIHQLKRIFCSVNVKIKKHDREYSKQKDDVNPASIKTREANKMVLGADSELPDYFDATRQLKIDNFKNMLKTLRTNIKETAFYRANKLSIEQVGTLCMIRSGLEECQEPLGKPKFANWNFNTIMPDQMLPYNEWKTKLITHKI